MLSVFTYTLRQPDCRHNDVHGKLKRQTRQFDVGVDAWDYRPVTLEQVLSFFRIRHRAAGF
jgi:calcineurin-like phosphoesterase family protein